MLPVTVPARAGRPIRRAALAAALLATVLHGCATSVPPPVGTAVAYPSPLAGPGVPPLESAEIKRLERGWQRLVAGDSATAAAAGVALAPASAAVLLELQAQLASRPAEAIPLLEQLVEDHDRYAAAWLTLSFAADAVGREETAYAAARRGAELWPDPEWVNRRDALRRRWIDQPVARAAGQLDDDPAAALAIANRALALDADDGEARLLAARALAALGRRDEADAAAASLAPDPRALMLRGELAEQRDDWLAAMELYRAVPHDEAGRERALKRVQMRWRLDVLPGWVRQATESPAITRAQLAVLLVSLLPGLESTPGGRTSLLSDIVDVPSQREILTVVRLGLMAVDQLEHRFHPDRSATAAETRSAIDAALAALGGDPVEWCADTVVSSACYTLATPVSGHDVTAVLLGVAEREMP